MISKIKKVLVIGPYAPSLMNFRGELLKEMRARGYEVHVAAPEMSPNLREYFSHLGIIPHEIEFNRAGINPISEVKTVYALWKLMQGTKPHVYFGYAPKPIMYGLPVAYLAGAKPYGMVTGLGYAFINSIGLKRKLVRLVSIILYRLGSSFSEKMFFQNPDDLADLSENGSIGKHQAKNAIIVNGSGIDLSQYNTSQPPKLPIRFFMASRLLADKGVREYAKAAGILKVKYPNVEFILAGPFDINLASIQKEELETWIKNNTITYLGVLPSIGAELANCHVFVLPSYREGTPRSVLEALSVGRAVITTDTPGCRETVVHNQNGFLVPPADADSLAVAMEKFIENPELISKMGTASRLYAEKKYDVRKVNSVILTEIGLL
jgi:glycosyltransferase involved in cell wall biosynthesis